MDENAGTGLVCGSGKADYGPRVGRGEAGRWFIGALGPGGGRAGPSREGELPVNRIAPRALVTLTPLFIGCRPRNIY